MSAVAKPRLSGSKPPPSTYLDAARYAQLDREHCRGRGRPDADDVAGRIASLVAYEARLLDEQRFEEWLNLFSHDCIYWIPLENPPGPAATTVSITLDDRRRLEDRVFRYRTGLAYSQLPLSRMARTMGLQECWWLEVGRRAVARSGFHISELRRGEINLYAGHVEHVFVIDGDAMLIQRKTVHLLAADQPLKNISFVF